MTRAFVVISNAGPNRDLRKGSRDQAYWDDHAAFIDGLVDEGFIVLGGPFDDGGAMIMVHAESEESVRTVLRDDPWFQHGILDLQCIRAWELFINRLST